MTFCSRCYAAKVEAAAATVHFQSWKISHEWHHYGDDHLPTARSVMSTLGGLGEVTKKEICKPLRQMPSDCQAGNCQSLQLSFFYKLSLLFVSLLAACKRACPLCIRVCRHSHTYMNSTSTIYFPNSPPQKKINSTIFKWNNVDIVDAKTEITSWP